MQVYLLLRADTSDGTFVLLAQKRVVGRRSGGRPVRQVILWNNGGQWVIPGGGYDKSDKNNVQAAYREFAEETGVDFNKEATRQTFGFTNPQEFSPERAYTVVTALIAKDAKPLKDTINKNINLSDPTVILDDELHEVAWIKLAEAVDKFGPPVEASWVEDQMKQAEENAAWYLKRQMNKPFDWFQVAVKRLQK